MKHGLSIDVEDYFEIIFQDYFHESIPPTAEVDRNTNWLLDVLASKNVKATFFVLANIAGQYPALVKRIVNEGHEIGVHGYDHVQIYKIKAEDFHKNIKKAKEEIENISGGRVLGHRAPTFSITKESLWAVDILCELGFVYDSSIFPIKGSRYGIPDTSQTIFCWPNGLYEIPLSCLDIMGKRVPVAGGGYLRHFPLWWTMFAIRRLEKLNRPAIIYTHPYEFENTYPEICITGKPIPAKLKIHTMLQSHNRGRRQKHKLLSLLSRFNLIPLKDLLGI